MRAAAFLDRDGTLMVDTDYVRRAEDVALLPDAAEAVRALNVAAVPVIVVTNQSGIARGLIRPEEYEAVHARLAELLAEQGARIDDVFMCPHHPELTGPCRCRKPGTLLYEEAVARHALDPEASLFAGDRWRDVAPASAFGGFGVLIPGARTAPAERERARNEASVSDSLLTAVERFLAGLSAHSRT